MNQILLIEDNPETRLLVSAALDSCKVSVVSTLKEAENKLKHDKFHLILLDVHLPDGDGFQFFLRIQSIPELAEVPVIFLTSRGETVDKVLGFRLGADDYITKPFDPLELKARVEARLRRFHEKSTKRENLKKGSLNFDLLRQRLEVKKNGVDTELPVTSLEFKLLLYLAQHEDHVLTREQIVESVWHNGLNVVDRTVDTHMSHLRQKLRGSGFEIQSVYGTGYRFSRAVAPPNKEGGEKAPFDYGANINC